MSNTTEAKGGGIGVGGLLGVAFIVLKLTGHISWPWLWVLAPFWLPLAIVLTVLVVALVIVGIASAIK